MSFGKIIRDVVVLLLFCGGVYGLTRIGDLLPEQAVEASEAEYSADRVTAETMLSEGRWEDAIVSYKRLLDDDPYNGHAWYWVGACHNDLVMFYRRQLTIAIEKRRSEERLNLYRGLIEENSRGAIPALERAMDFARFRNFSRTLLAGLYANGGREEEAFQLLRDMFAEGFTTNQGLERRPDLIPLRKFDAFQELLVLEREVRSRRRESQQRSIGVGR